MASDLENLIETIEKLSIEPVYDTNWNDMPAEIKLECIGKMELKERLSLRCTSKAERSLVDSQKIKFTKGILCGDYVVCFEFYPDISYNFSLSSRFMSETLESIKYVKKIGVFENLTFTLSYPFRLEEKFYTDDELFKAKNIEFNMFDTDQVVPVFRKMNNGIESIKINAYDTLSDELGQILAISHVQNVPYWHIQNYDEIDILHKVAQMWIETNSKIGFTFQVSVSGDGSFGEFLKHFDDRIMSTSVKRARIGTNDPDRHILLERGLDDVVTITYHIQFFRLIVISAEMKESDYSDDCKEWICKINSQPYTNYDSDNSSDNRDDFYHNDYQDYDIYDSDWYDSDNDGWNPDNY
ncbi:unnamed protein product [Caenorhabditis nigoni]